MILLEVRDGYFKGFGRYLKTFSLKPYRLPLAALLLAALLMIFDPMLLPLVQNQDSLLASFVTSFGGSMGRSSNCWIFLIVCYLIAWLAKLKKERKLLFGALLSSFITSGLATFFKFLLLRARPEAELGPYSFFHFEGLIYDERMFQSFPSGDVAVVAGAAVFFFYALKNRVAKWLIFLLPLCTAFARVSVNRHWPSDTAIAMSLGWIAAAWVWNYHKQVQPVT